MWMVGKRVEREREDMCQAVDARSFPILLFRFPHCVLFIFKEITNHWFCIRCNWSPISLTFLVN